MLLYLQRELSINQYPHLHRIRNITVGIILLTSKIIVGMEVEVEVGAEVVVEVEVVVLLQVAGNKERTRDFFKTHVP